MVSLTPISISTDDTTSDDGGRWVEEACGNVGGAEEQEALQLSGVEEEGTGGASAGDADIWFVDHV
jgi:hypothetical protein